MSEGGDYSDKDSGASDNDDLKEIEEDEMNDSGEENELEEDEENNEEEEENDEEEEDDEEDDDEEDSDGEPVRRSLKRGAKGLKGKSKRTNILDVLESEAEEGSDEEDEDKPEDGYEFQRLKEKEEDYRKLYVRKKADPFQSIVEDLASKVQEYSFSVITNN